MIQYSKALNEGNSDEAQKLYDESRELNSKLLTIFKAARDE